MAPSGKIFNTLIKLNVLGNQKLKAPFNLSLWAFLTHEIQRNPDPQEPVHFSKLSRVDKKG